MIERVDRRWTVGPYAFEAVSGHGFSYPEFPKVLYRFRIDGKGNGEVYQSLDRAIVSAVGEKNTGRRGAGGTGVGTAADWFAVMIGLDHVEDEAATARMAPGVAEALADSCAYTFAHTWSFCGNQECREF